MNPYGVQGGGPSNSGSDAYMFPGWGSVQSGYQGSSPYGPQGKPTWMGAINQLGNPFSKDPYWGNPVDNNSSAFQSLASKPFDSAAWIGQRIAMPAVVFGGASAAFSGVGRSIGQGLGRGLFGAGMMGAGAGSVLGTIGSFGLPFAIGTAAAHAVDAAIFQPYIRTRQQSEDIARNFSGVAFGGSVGNPISGRGLNRASSASLAQGIDRAGINDMTFSATQMHSIAGMSMRAGLFDDVGSGQIQTRFRDIAAQVKLLVSISKDPNIQSAIEQLAQLRAGGASINGGVHSTAARAFSQMGMQASAAGVSVQQLMAASQSGQYMYQANGMTPYLGMMAAGNAYAGFSGAFRAGSLSPELLARMGGLQGATNSSLGAQLAGANSQFNMMSLYNKNFGGGVGGSSMTGVAGGFGALASRNPLQVAGDMLLYGPAMRSKQSRDGGSTDLENQAIQILRGSGQRPSGSGGRWSPSQIAMAMQSIPGITEDQIRAYAAQRAAETDPAALNQRLAGIDAQGHEQMMQTITQGGMYNGVVGRMATGVRRGVKSLETNIANNLVYPVTDAVGAAGDWVSDEYNKLMYGSTLSSGRPNFSGGNRIHKASFVNNKLSVAGDNAGQQEFYDRLNREAGRNTPLGELARKILGGQGGKAEVSRFAKDAGLTDASEAMDAGPDFYNSVAKDLGNKTLNYADKASASSVAAQLSLAGVSGADSFAVAKQARMAVMDADKTGIGLGTRLDDLLKDAKYGALGKQLAKYTPAQRAAIVKQDVARSLSAGFNDSTGALDTNWGVQVADDSDTGKLAQLVSQSMNRSDAAQKAHDDAKSPVDWRSMTDNMTKFDSAVDTFAKAVAAMPGAKPMENAKPAADWKSGKAWSDSIHEMFKSW